MRCRQISWLGCRLCKRKDKIHDEKDHIDTNNRGAIMSTKERIHTILLLNSRIVQSYRTIAHQDTHRVGRSIRRQRSGRFRRRAQVRITLAWRRFDLTHSTIRRLSTPRTTLPIGSTRRSNRQIGALSTSSSAWNFRAVCIGSTRFGSILDTETTGGVNRLVGWRWRRRNGGAGLYIIQQNQK